MQFPIGMNEEEEQWITDAKCKGQVGLFYPDEDDPDHRKKLFQAKSICNTCPSKTDCLTVAIVNGERFGVWGGLTARQLSRLRNQIGVRSESHIRKYIEEKVFNV